MSQQQGDVEFTRLVLGIAGAITSNGALFTFPTDLYIIFWPYRWVGDHPPWQHLIAFLNCMLWVLFGLPFVFPDSLLLTISYGVGCLISFVYLLLFAIYSKSLNYRRNVINYMILEIIFVGIVAVVVLNMAHDTKPRSQMVGIVAMISHVGLYASELPSMMLAIKTKSIEPLSPIRWSAYFMGFFFWSPYAFYPWNLYLFVPQVVLVIVVVAQLLLFEIYKDPEMVIDLEAYY